MRKLIGNAFSLQMLDLSEETCVRVTPMTIEQVASEENLHSVIGHADTASVVSTILGREVNFNRESVKLHKGDELFVAQVTGGRLPEGATTLPEGFQLCFVKVTLEG